ncbi:fructose PTS transporter subunit IIA [Wukongibacter baidiensis]|uniref:PTS sugar transporter subunit IIA n=1 Tax=Wukongibacter baidiensis TaxID=1723361 RepID=UPI003D7FCD85
MDKIIDINLIDLNLNCISIEEVIEAMAELMDRCGRLNDKEAYIKAVMERERLSSTGIGFGIGIPHGKSNAVKVPSLALGRIKQGIEWQSLDGEPVNIVFLIAVPQESSNQHLKILASLSRKLMDKGFIKQLKETDDEELLINVIESAVG